MENKIKNILYIGNYLEWYPRNYNFIYGLKKQNVNVYSFRFYKGRLKEKLRFLLKDFKKLVKQDLDFIIYFSWENSTIFLLTRFLAWIKRIPLINDYFISRLITFFYDRKPIGRRKKYLRRLYWAHHYISDFLECHLSDIIILDTASQIKYFYETYRIPVKKFRRVFVGARDDIYHPLNKNKSDNVKITIGFYGSYYKLHGVKYIIKAIKLLEHDKDLKFKLIGRGHTTIKNKELAKKLNLKNIEFIDLVPIETLPKLISEFDIGLGIFGTSPKTPLVIPNKVFDGIAMKIPMITSDSPAIREVFTDNENIILCKPANPKSLAEAILKLKNDKNLRFKISENAYELVKKYFTIEKIGERLIKILENIKRT